MDALHRQHLRAACAATVVVLAAHALLLRTLPQAAPGHDGPAAHMMRTSVTVRQLVWPLPSHATADASGAPAVPSNMAAPPQSVPLQGRASAQSPPVPLPSATSATPAMPDAPEALQKAARGRTAIAAGQAQRVPELAAARPSVPAATPAEEPDADADGAPPDAQAAAGPPPPRYATALPPSQTLQFKLQRGAASGRAELRWQTDGTHYELSLRRELGRIAGLTLASRGAIDGDGIAPERQVEVRRGRELRAVNFQREPGRITFSGPTSQYELPAGAQDRLSWMVQLGAVLAATRRWRSPGRRCCCSSPARGATPKCGASTCAGPKY